MALSNSEKERYRRQILVDGWDQEKLKEACVLIVGLGGLGGVSATYLAAAGVGRLRICDSDRVELSNLNRQILFSTGDIGKPKALLAQRALSALNPDIKIVSYTDKINDDNISRLASGCNLIIDGLDNHKDRLILNQASFDLKVPYVYGAINGWQGQIGFFNPPQTPCLACLLPHDIKGPKPTPVFGALPAVIGSIQASMAIQFLLNSEIPLSGKLLTYNADTIAFETVAFDKNPNCPICSGTQ